MGGEKSEAFYQDFLQHMRTVYRADAVKGNDIFVLFHCCLISFPLFAVWISLSFFARIWEQLANELAVSFKIIQSH